MRILEALEVIGEYYYSVDATSLVLNSWDQTKLLKFVGALKSYLECERIREFKHPLNESEARILQAID